MKYLIIGFFITLIVALFIAFGIYAYKEALRELDKHSKQ